MYKHCEKCKKDYDCTLKKCPICGKNLLKKYTEKELEEIKKQDDDFITSSTLFM